MERLTRAAFLISKATVLFLPVSFMTSYFATDFASVHFTVKTYWVSFSVVLALSALVLVGFGAISGTLDSRNYVKLVRPLAQCYWWAKGESQPMEKQSSMLKMENRKLRREEGVARQCV